MQNYMYLSYFGRPFDETLLLKSSSVEEGLRGALSVGCFTRNSLNFPAFEL